MKLATFTSLFAIVAALPLASVGCHKNLDKTTVIPKGAQPVIGGDPAAGPRGIGVTDAIPTQPVGPDPTAINSTPIQPPTKTGSGIEQAKGDFTGWKENRDEFKAQTVYFDFDKSNVKASELSKLKEVASRMKSSFQGKALRIEGHCDERGTEEYNRALGDKRALSIREQLVSLGMDAEMIPTISMGEEKPADPGHTEAAWSKNRRGELILLSPPGGSEK